MISALIVDDDPTFLETISDRIALRLPWRIASATSYRQAVERLSWYRYDMLVTDLHMPGQDGAALLKLAASEHPELVRVLITGAGFDTRMAEAMRFAHDCLVKPFDIDALNGAWRRAEWLEQYGTKK